MTAASLTERTRALCLDLAGLAAGRPEAAGFADLALRLDEPLRLAVAGRLKAGKSTLLNALVGEMLAATDETECTRLVTWYVEGRTYGATAVGRDGQRRPARLRRDELGRVSIEIGGDPGEVDRLEVSWPSSSLRTLTLIDTPGLESIDDSVSVRTRDFLAPEDGSAEADAVVYLLRHLHARDAHFLEAFADRSLASASPANAIAVLSRADEIAGGRSDAMDAATRISQRYAGDERVRQLCAAVVPVAGLLAEAAATLAEHEAAWLRTLAAMPAAEAEAALVSAERFLRAPDVPLAPEIRTDLLQRLGLFGLRQAVGALRDGVVDTTPDLARHLLEVSGVPALRSLIERRFVRQAAGLKARSVLASARALGRALAGTDPSLASAVEARVEELEASAPELAELRAETLVLAGATRLDGASVRLALEVLGGGGPATTTGRDVEDVRRTALVGVGEWRERASNPLFDPATVEVCEVVARVLERTYLEASGHRNHGG